MFSARLLPAFYHNATGSADTITLGAGNDTYVLGTATNSVLAKADTITDFQANTKAMVQLLLISQKVQLQLLLI